MLKMASESFIDALLLFLGLFLKISLWLPLTLSRTQAYCTQISKLRSKKPEKKKLSHLSLLSGRSFRAFFDNFAYLVTATSTLILFY